MSLSNLTPSQLRQAADLKEKIAGLEKQLADLSGSPATPKAESVVKPAKRTISASHKAKIRAAQKLRWSKVSAAKGKTVAEKVIKAVKAVSAQKTGKKSAAAKANQSAKMKAYWAAKKAGLGKK